MDFTVLAPPFDTGIGKYSLRREELSLHPSFLSEPSPDLHLTFPSRQYQLRACTSELPAFTHDPVQSSVHIFSVCHSSTPLLSTNSRLSHQPIVTK